MILPVGHESDTVRRIPWITIIFMGICLLAHIFVSREMDQSRRELETRLKALFQYYFQHPYLELDKEVRGLLSVDDSQMRELLDAFRIYHQAPDDQSLRFEQQRKLDNLVLGVKTAIGNVPYRKWGLIPKHKTFRGFFTHMFVHSGWLHLFGNLLLLYLTGPFIEDVWGRPVYLISYIGMGMFAALMFSAIYPNFSGPLVGASGAISGLMGAFLVRFWKTRIKFVYFFIFPLFVRGSFKAPAWIMLPMWFILEIFNARMMDSMESHSGAGVAHWAHVWGFMFGVFLALMIRWLRIEQKFISKKIESQTSYVNPVYRKFLEAQKLIESGSKQDGFTLLMETARADPGYPEIWEMLWTTGRDLGRVREASGVFVRIIENEISQGRIDVALNHYYQLKKGFPGKTIGISSKLALLDYLLKHEAEKEARTLLEKDVLEAVTPRSPPGILLALSAMPAIMNRETRRNILEWTLGHPEVPQSRKKELKKEAFGIGDTAPVTGEGKRDGDSSEKALAGQNNNAGIFLAVTRAKPLALLEGKLILELENRKRKVLILEKVKTISVIKVAEASVKPYLLIDLVLDDPQSPGVRFRSLRLESQTFNPLSLIDQAKTPLDAFRGFVNGLLKSCQARPFPDIESVELKKFTVYHSVKSYERSLCAQLLGK